MAKLSHVLCFQRFTLRVTYIICAIWIQNCSETYQQCNPEAVRVNGMLEATDTDGKQMKRNIKHKTGNNIGHYRLYKSEKNFTDQNA